MAAHTFSDLLFHVGHKIECAEYGNAQTGIVNVAVECMDCYEVLLDFDRPESETQDKNDR